MLSSIDKLACHKLNPSGGAGAVNAMHDAAVLANYINALPLHPVIDEIERAFELYRTERIEWVERAFETSQMLQALVAKVKIESRRVCDRVDIFVLLEHSTFYHLILSWLHVGLEGDSCAVHDEEHARVLEAQSSGADVQLSTSVGIFTPGRDTSACQACVPAQFESKGTSTGREGCGPICPDCLSQIKRAISTQICYMGFVLVFLVYGENNECTAWCDLHFAHNLWHSEKSIEEWNYQTVSHRATLHFCCLSNRRFSPLFHTHDERLFFDEVVEPSAHPKIASSKWMMGGWTHK